MKYFFYHAFRRTFLALYRTFFHFEAYGLENIPPRGAALLVANHASYLDPPALGIASSRYIAFVARGTLADSKVFELFFYLVKGIPIRRGEPDTEAFRKILRKLSEGELVGLFPEGTRSRDGNLGTFNEGAIWMARRAKVPIIPLAIAGTFEAFPKGRSWPRRHPVRVVYGIPLDASVGTREEANENLRRQIGLLLEQARSHHPV